MAELKVVKKQQPYVRDKYFPLTKELLEMEWQKLNESYNIKKGGVYYLDNFVSIDIAIDEADEIVVAKNRFSAVLMKKRCADITNSEDFGKILIDFIVNEKRLAKTPHIVHHPFLYDRGIKRKTGWEGGVYWNKTHFINEVAFPKINKNTTDLQLDEIDSILRDILETDERIRLFKSFLAQFAFDNRADKARSTLIAYDKQKRGTGKGLLSKFFASRIFPHQTTTISDLLKNDFNGFAENKMIFIDEAEGIDMASKNQLAKITSGVEFVTVNRKNIEAYKIKNKAYMYFASNQLPLSIKDRPTNSRENQWVVFRFETQLAEKENFQKLEVKYNRDFTPLFEKAFGKWLHERLLPFYLKTMQKEIGRYGFDIPITTEMLPLLMVGKASGEQGVVDIFESILQIDEESIALERELDSNMGTLISLFQTTGFFANKLLELQGIKKMHPTTFAKNAFLVPGLIVEQSCMRKVKGKNYRGKMINLNFLNRVDFEEKELTDEEEFQLFASKI